MGRRQWDGGEQKGSNSPVLDRKWQRGWGKEEKSNIKKRAEVIKLADWLAYLGADCSLTQWECLVYS